MDKDMRFFLSASWYLFSFMLSAMQDDDHIELVKKLDTELALIAVPWDKYEGSPHFPLNINRDLDILRKGGLTWCVYKKKEDKRKLIGIVNALIVINDYESYANMTYIFDIKYETSLEAELAFKMVIDHLLRDKSKPLNGFVMDFDSRDKVLVKIAEKLNMTPARFSIRWFKYVRMPGQGNKTTP
jgi:hypothetical protein